MISRWSIVLALLLCCLARSQTCSDCGVGGTCVAGLCHCTSPYVGTNCSMQGNTLVMSEALTMDWKLDADEGYLYVRLEAETSSWAAVMMAPDARDGMSGGDCWRLGYDGAGVPQMADMYATGHSTPFMDTQQDLEDVVTFESVGPKKNGDAGTRTTLVSVFRRKLVSDDAQHDNTIVNGAMYMSWAVGSGAQGSFSQHGGSSSSRAVIFVDFVNNQVSTYGKPKQYTLLAFGGWLFLTMFVGSLLFHVSSFRLSSLGQNLLHCHPFYKLAKLDRQKSPRPGRLLSSLSLGEILVLVLYGAAWVVFMATATKTYDDANDDLVLVLGHLTAIHLALSFLPVAKNSVWLFVMGLPFERAIKWHRWVSRVCMLLCTIHGATMIDRLGWSSATATGETEEGYGNIYGALAWLFMVLMVVTSFPRWRRFLHRAFLLVHQVLLLAVFVMAALHSKHAFYLSVGVVALWWVDRLVRWRRASLEVQVVNARLHNGVHTVVELTLKQQSFRYEVGQYVYLCVPEIGMFDWHPFTISSCPTASASSHTFTLHIQAMPYQPFPIPLLSSLSSSSSSSSASASATPKTTPSSSSPSPSSPSLSAKPRNWTQKFVQWVTLHGKQPANLKLEMDGPYGQVGAPVFDDYSHIVLCAGGIGVTPLMSVLSELYHRHRHQRGSLKHVQSVWLVWSCRDLEAFQSWFSKLLGDIQQSDSSVFRLSFFLTSGNSQQANQQVELQETAVQTPSLPSPSPSSSASSPSSSSFPTFHDSPDEKKRETESENESEKESKNEITPLTSSSSTSTSSSTSSSAQTANAYKGRPVFSELFSQIKAEAGRKVCVLTCGPDSMMDEVQLAALSRNFHLHRETFAL